MALVQPSDYARLFEFGPEDCLYRDHLGRRVVGEVEGPGVVVEAIGVTIESDGALGGNLFSDYALAIGNEGEPTLLAVSSVDVSTEREWVWSTSKSVQGVGWVHANRGVILAVDGLPKVQRSSSVPIPFFLGVESSASFSFALDASARRRLVQDWSIDDTHKLAKLGFQVRNISKVTELASSFSSGIKRRGFVASHLNEASFRVDISAQATGLRLRKLYDRFHGRQRARILVDDVYVGTWLAIEENRVERWGASEFGFAITPGRESVKITIDPPASVPLWSVSEMTVFELYREVNF